MTMNSHVARYGRHVVELAIAFKIAIQVIADPDQAAAGYIKADKDLPMDQWRSVISIAPVIDETTYAVALHELGHCLAPCGRLCLTQGSRPMRTAQRPTTLRDVKLQIEEERAAWDWARYYALEWTPAMQGIERYSINSYRDYAKHYGVKL